MEFQNRETERQQFEDLIFPTPPSTIYVSHFPKTDEKAYEDACGIYSLYHAFVFHPELCLFICVSVMAIKIHC